MVNSVVFMKSAVMTVSSIIMQLFPRQPPVLILDLEIANMFISQQLYNIELYINMYSYFLCFSGSRGMNQNEPNLGLLRRFLMDTMLKRDVALYPIHQWKKTL